MMRSLGAVLIGLVLFGAGCEMPRFFRSPSITPAALEAAHVQALQLIAHPGDQITLRQMTLSLELLLDRVKPPQTGVRELVLHSVTGTRSLAWSMRVERETAASRVAREAYDAERRAHPRAVGEADSAPPALVLEQAMVTGTVRGFDTKTALRLRLPAFWPEGIMEDVQKTSGIWLSEQAFATLRDTRVTEVDPGIQDSPITSLLKAKEAWDAFTKRLKNEAVSSTTSGSDQAWQADASFVLWPLRVNGKDVTVSAIHAKHRLGEFTILNNPQNPLILKFEMNPFTSETFFGGGQADMYAQALGFQVTEIRTAP